MNVGIIVPNASSTGGPSIQAKNLIKGLASINSGITNIHILSRQSAENQWFTDDSVHVHQTFHTESYYKSIKKFLSILSEIDVLHLFASERRIFYAAVFQPYVPVLVGPSVNKGYFNKYSRKYLYSFNYKFVFTSDETMQYAINVNGHPTEKTVFIPNGVDTEHFQPIEGNFADRLDKLPDCITDGSKKTILWANHLQDIKRPLLAIKAFKQLRDERNDVSFMMAGDGPLREDVVELIDAIPDAHYIGYIQHRELVYYYNYSNVKLLTSKSEGSTSVLLEAMACGTPVVTATDFDKIDDGRDPGIFLSSKSTAKQIANGISRCFDEMKRKPWEELAREHVINNYDFKDRAKKYNLAYKWVKRVGKKPEFDVGWEDENVVRMGGEHFSNWWR